MDKWIDDIPPVDQPVRFGNTAYRDWFAKLEEVGKSIVLIVIDVWSTIKRKLLRY